MDAKAFDDIFEDVVVRPLTAEGFRREGKSLYMDDGILQVAWMRGSTGSPASGTRTIAPS